MIGPQASLASPRELPESSPRVTPLSDGLIVEWNAPYPLISEGADGQSVIKIPGYINTNQPGAPRVPFASVLVALPDGAIPSVEVQTASESIKQLNSPLELGKVPNGVQLDSGGQIIGGAFASSDFEVSGSTKVVQLEQIGVVRGAHLARLTFFPVRVSDQQLLVTTNLKVKINFGALLQSRLTRDNPLLTMLESAVVNPQQLQTAPVRSGGASLKSAEQLTSDQTAAIEVSARGITEVSYSDLAGIGFPVSTSNPNQLHLNRAGKPIDYQWLGDGDTIFEQNESLFFFADPRFNRWTSADTYFLSTESTNGSRMGSRSADAGITAGTPWVERLFEENKIYTPECYCAPIPAGRDGDRWVWDRLQKPDPAVGTYNFQLKGVDQTQTAKMSIWLIGFTSLTTNPDHHVEINLNGHDLGTKQWDGKNAYQANFSFSGNYLNEGENTLTITLPDVAGIEVNGIWLDAFSVRHAHSANLAASETLLFSGENSRKEYTFSVPSGTAFAAYDVTDPDKAEVLTGIPQGATSITISDPQPFKNPNHNYWIGSAAQIQGAENLRMVSPSLLEPGFNGADYLIISPAEFIPSLAPLIGLHQSNGLEVAVEDVQAIYDSYGEGRPEPDAIRAFLEDAYFSWDKNPLYVLLVGDGTHDPRGYLPSSSETLIPPFLADVDPWAGETAADNRYVTIDGADTLPDMLIGRLPANDSQELDTMISKIVQYANKPVSLWHHQAVFVADDTDPRSGDFPSKTEILIRQFPTDPFAPERLYYDPNQATPEEFRTKIQQAWDAGKAMIMFTGHSSIYQWAHEIFLHSDDVPNLKNGQKLPVVLEMTCFTGSFQIPGNPTLDEELLRHPGGGAVAVWGATGLGVSTGHHWLAEGFMKTVFTHGISDLGSAALAGKLNLTSVGVNPDLVDTFTLLGDPATKLERSFQNYIPITID